MKTILDNLVSIEEAAEKLGVTPKTIRNWRHQGLYRERFVKFGGRLRIDMGEFEKDAQRQKEAARDQSRRLGLA